MQCVTLTGCGNFVLLGMSTGHIEMFNVQSGIHRGEFGRPRGECVLIEDLLLMIVYFVCPQPTPSLYEE